MDRLLPALIALGIALGILSSSMFVVHQRDYAVVFALGEIRRVISEPGLYFKLPPPFQNVVFFDKRVLTIDSPDAERVQTSEKINMLVDSFVKWRITDPRTYFVTFGGNERAATDRLNAIIRDAMNAAINRRTVNDVTSRERSVIMQEIRESVSAQAQSLGVEIVDVRLKRVDFVPEISESVYRRMEAERKRVANEQRSIGAAEGERIRADADRQREVIVAQAYREAQQVMGEGDAEASRILSSAFGEDREFFNFVRSLEAYRSIFQSNDVMVLDPESEFFRVLRDGPGASALPSSR